MNRQSLLLIMLFLTCGVAGMWAQSIGVFVTDVDSYTNVRNAPKGKVVGKIVSDGMASLEVMAPKNGWWQIVGDEYDHPERNDTQFTGSKTGYWIHYSVIGINTRNYGSQRLSLRDKPGGKAVFSFTKELTLHPLEIKGTWVKVQTMDGRHTGWIEDEWLCGNPLTNCC